MRTNQYEAVIGMEIHVQLKTRSKMFCACAVQFKDRPNSNVCPICLGLPGTLPTVNLEAVRLAIKTALALNCTINKKSSFARKHYFYPDLPKGYQITQYKEPLAVNGHVEINGKKIRIKRLHLEEDSGKLIHSGRESLVDFNRCGVPLIEIVTEPDIRSPEEAVQYLGELKRILTYLNVSDCDMEKGHFRCEPNVSLRKVGETQLGVRTELKNLNSLRNVKEGLEFEINRQTKILTQGGKVVQETLLWDEKTKTALPMRSKEESEDYRYFFEPDLPPLIVPQSLINEIQSEIPLLPQARKKILVNKYQLNEESADIIIESKEFADYFDAVIKHCSNVQLVANWLITEVRGVLNTQNIPINEFPVSPDVLGELLTMIDRKEITIKAGKMIFEEILKTGRRAREIAEEKGLLISFEEDTLIKIIKETIQENHDVVEKYRKGKTTVLGFLVGEVLRKVKGKFLPQRVSELISKFLNESQP
ncbi:MAG: Asp-tRNA(Asn)/Glu-tRNA(Gln) amidotransferase subunit GatB [candidate division WOR-3 bacterium]|nr:Asp-tRNA(Asn)/Glu-tRNA(Gln) amidotransferase subunit GatB [candidate division WOR-3 bacterium]MDW7988196.1 Asp-tRNA(Asn)/Glu-tRNA(Gln) amidotransferase subunit GatB [candidate division WOR-3 bacterium]